MMKTEQSERCEQCGAHDADLIKGACHPCAEIAIRCIILGTITPKKAGELLYKRRVAVYQARH